MGDDPDRELMERAQEGDRASFDELVRVHHRAVWSYARRALGDAELAQEVAQDAFVRAWRYRASYRAGAGTVRAWLFAVVANRIRDARKARHQQPLPLAEAESVPSREALGAFERGAVREQVARAIDALPEELRDVMTLRYVSDLSMEDVARALGISVGAAKMRALRARDQLARRLADLAPRGGGA